MSDGMTNGAMARSAKKAASKAQVAAGATISVTTQVAKLSQLGPIAGAAGAAVSATGIGLVITGGVLQVIGIGKNSVAAVKSHKHMKGLIDIQGRASSLQCECDGDVMEHQAIVCSILPYLIDQKQTKRNRRIHSAIPCVGLLETIRAVGKHTWKAYKGTLGKKRIGFAEILATHLTNPTGSCSLVQEIVAELYDMPSMIWIRDACNHTVATELICEKMKSR